MQHSKVFLYSVIDNVMAETSDIRVGFLIDHDFLMMSKQIKLMENTITTIQKYILEPNKSIELIELQLRNIENKITKNKKIINNKIDNITFKKLMNIKQKYKAMAKRKFIINDTEIKSQRDLPKLREDINKYKTKQIPDFYQNADGEIEIVQKQFNEILDEFKIQLQKELKIIQENSFIGEASGTNPNTIHNQDQVNELHELNSDKDININKDNLLLNTAIKSAPDAYENNSKNESFTLIAKYINNKNLQYSFFILLSGVGGYGFYHFFFKNKNQNNDDSKITIK